MGQKNSKTNNPIYPHGGDYIETLAQLQPINKIQHTNALEFSQLHLTCNHLSSLHDFCEFYGFGYGMYEDGSVYVSESTNKSTSWWGRLFPTGVIETNFYQTDRQHLNPILSEIFYRLRETNKNQFNE